MSRPLLLLRERERERERESSAKRLKAEKTISRETMVSTHSTLEPRKAKGETRGDCLKGTRSRGGYYSTLASEEDIVR